MIICLQEPPWAGTYIHLEKYLIRHSHLIFPFWWFYKFYTLDYKETVIESKRIFNVIINALHIMLLPSDSIKWISGPYFGFYSCSGLTQILFMEPIYGLPSVCLFI